MYLLLNCAQAPPSSKFYSMEDIYYKMKKLLPFAYKKVAKVTRGSKKQLVEFLLSFAHRADLYASQQKCRWLCNCPG